MTDRNDYKTTIIHGKSAPKSREINIDNVHKKTSHQTNGMNSSVLERKIEEGSISVAPKISLDAGRIISTARTQQQINEKTMTQQQLAQKANTCGGKGITQTDIGEMESGKLILNHINKLKVRAVQKALSIQSLEL